MPIEPATYIDGLNPSNPPSGDSVGEGDDHLRLIKSALKNTFPNIFAAVTATAAELNQLSGTTITAFAKLLLASPSAATAIATLVAPGASGNVMTSNGTTWISAALPVGQVDVQTFNYTGGNQTWTKPSFGTIAIIECWGGGGSGGKSNGSLVGGGGGGGNYVMRILPLSALNATEIVYVGAGGAAVSGSASNGNDGQNTTFGSHVTAHGGGRGFYNSRGGGGGAAGTGWHQGNYGGGNGGSADYDTPIIPTGSTFGGGGGSSFSGYLGGGSMFGGAGGGAGGTGSGGLGGTSLFGGNGGNGGRDANAQAGSVPGGGGGGCWSSTSGHTSGAGGHGRCRVTVF